MPRQPRERQPLFDGSVTLEYATNTHCLAGKPRKSSIHGLIIDGCPCAGPPVSLLIAQAFFRLS
jgi:hypothetical protein